MVAHDLVNMLTGLNAYLTMLDEEGLTAPEAAEMVRRARRAAERVTLLSEDLLLGHPPDRATRRLVLTRLALDRELESCAEVFPGLELEISCPAGLVVLADRLRLHQVLVNLVRNAERYGAAPVRLAASSAGTTVRIAVTDSGPGVAEELVPRLFDYCSRGRGVGRSGSGLGLALVRELAELQGGSATYDENDRAFVVTLMAPREPSPARRPLGLRGDHDGSPGED